MLAAATKYAIKALQYLATQDTEIFVQVKTLSQESEVPGPYLAKIIKTLAAREIVETRRGLAGGVRLARRAKDCSYYDICVALDDPVVMEQCILSRTKCNAQQPCSRHREWRAAKETLTAFLKNARLDG